MVEEFRSRPLDQGPYPYLRLDALTQRRREGGRIVNVATVVATTVRQDGRREVPGVDVFTAEDGAAWLGFLRSQVATGLTRVQLAISDDHLGLKAALAATLPGTSRPRCRVHFQRNLLTQVPKSTQTIVATLVRSIFAQPDEAEVLAQHQRVWSSSPTASHRPVPCWRRPVSRCWPPPAFPRSTGARPAPTPPTSGSTGRSAGAPMWWASSPTGKP
jgi:putative transposase